MVNPSPKLCAIFPKETNVYTNAALIVLTHNIPGTWLPNKQHHDCNQPLSKSKCRSQSRTVDQDGSKHWRHDTTDGLRLICVDNNSERG